MRIFACEQGGSISCSTSPSATAYKATFIQQYKDAQSVRLLGGFVKAKHSASYGQLIFQNGAVTKSDVILSVVAYGSNGNISHSICGGTCYWYAAGYIS